MSSFGYHARQDSRASGGFVVKSSGLVFLLLSVLVIVVPVSGQTPGPPISGIDISGSWFPGRHQDATLGTAAGAMVDWGGIPINDAARLYGLSWNASRITVRQHQCAGYVPPYFYYAPGNYRFWEERDPVTQRLIAIKMYAQVSEGLRTIWMDGRPHPPAYAQHTWSGFSTGKYEGHILTVYTTHIKRGWHRANGALQSDQATVVEHFIRHGERMTYFSVVNDPVNLDEPFPKTSNLVHVPNDPNSWTMPCDDGEIIPGQAKDRVDNYLWGQHPFLQEF